MQKENIAENVSFIYMMKYLVIFSPFIIYLSFVQQYALNLPRMDDYDAILNFLNNFKKAQFAEKLSLLFSQHNEHRIFTSRLVYAIYYEVFGHINFRNIIFINAITIFFIYLILVYFIKKLMPVLWPLAALAFSMCIFDINGFENADFAMAGMQNYGVILFFVASIFFYSLESKKFIPLAALCQVLCIFSSGNGNLGAFLVLLFTIFNKEKTKTITALMCLLIFAPLYYLHYIKPPTNFFTLNPSKFIPYFFHSLGAHFGYHLGFFAGAGLFVSLIGLLPFTDGFKTKENTLPFVFISGFVICSMGIMSVFRGNLPIEGSQSSRYYIYSHLLVALVFLFILLKLEGKKMQLQIATAMILVLFVLYRKNYNEGKSGFEYFYSSLKNNEFDYPDKPWAKQITDEACQLHIYCIGEERAKIKW